MERVIEKMAPLVTGQAEARIYGRSGAGLGAVGQIGGVRCERFPAGDKAVYLRSVSRAIRLFRPDLIEVENRPGYALKMKGNHPDARIWINLHSSSFIGPKAISRDRLKRSFAAAEKIIVNSEFLRDTVAGRVPEAAHKLRVVHIGVDTARFPSRWEPEGAARREALRHARGWQDRDVLLFMGRIIPLKGVHHLLRVMPDIIALHPNVLLAVVGSPFYGSHRTTRYSRALQALGKRYPRHIRFIPYVPYPEVPSWFLAADAAVVPSGSRESFGLVNVEAMSCGLPVVATRAGGMKEIIVDGSTGFLVEPGRLETELKARLLQLLLDPGLREEMGRRGRERVMAEFTWEATAARWAGLLKE